jgi:hypothetical protein
MEERGGTPSRRARLLRAMAERRGGLLHQDGKRREKGAVSRRWWEGEGMRLRRGRRNE